MTIAKREKKREMGPVIRQLLKMIHKFLEDQLKSIYEKRWQC